MNRLLPLLLLALVPALVPAASAQQRPAPRDDGRLDVGRRAAAAVAPVGERHLRAERPERYALDPATGRPALTPEARAETERRAAPRRAALLERLAREPQRPRATGRAPQPPEQRGAVTVYTVDSAYDEADFDIGDGVCETFFWECTLRAAIEQANARPDTEPVRIEFEIGSGPIGPTPSGVWTIPVGSGSLPFSTQPNLTIDGLTQGTASCGNLVNGTPHNLKVVLDGSLSGTLGVGLEGGGQNFTARGLVVSNFPRYGILAPSFGGLVECNYVGTDVTGELAAGNGEGIYINGTARNNLISGNDDNGILVFHPSTTVTRNLVGTDDDGNQPLGNGLAGIRVRGNDATVSTNLVSDNGFIGIELFFGATGATVTGNTVGLSRLRTNLVDLGGHGPGILVSDGASGNDIGLPGNGNFVARSGYFFGIVVAGTGTNNNRIRGNTVGLDAAGNAAPSFGGIYVGERVGDEDPIGSASGTTVGGTAAGAGNVVAGHTTYGIHLSGDIGTLVVGNTVGLNAAGIARPNGSGGIVFGDGFNPGSTGSTARANTVSGNGGSGIIAFAPSSGVVIENNSVGTNAAGTAARPNALSGIAVVGTAGTVVRGNVSSANVDAGLYLEDTTGDVIEDNTLGTDPAGTLDLGNGLAGLYCFSASDSRIGGTALGLGNTVAFNDGDGVFLGPACQDIALLRNAIYSNDGLGIDLASNGVTPNDPDDADTGANQRTNFPVVTAATYDGANARVSFALDALASTTYRVEFFTSAGADPTGYGEGRTFQGSVNATTNASGVATGTATRPVPPSAVGQWVTATATPVAGSEPTGFRGTSEFSRAVQIVGTGALATATDSLAASVGEEAATAAASLVTTGLPTAYALHAATPNPFAARTTLRYDLPGGGRVRLVVYDLLGREVARVVEAERPAGSHEATLEAGHLAPGVYVVRLTAGAFVAARRLTVAR